MRKVRIFIYALLLVLFTAPLWAVSHAITKNGILSTPINTIKTIKTLGDSLVSVKVDTIRIPVDSLKADSIARKKSALEDIVDYKAKDSIVLTGDNWGYLYGEGQVDYTSLVLKAERISMNMDSSVAKATFGVDTAGVEIGYPIFTDNGTDYEAKSMNYNLKTKKMFVNEVITEQGEGFITAGVAKKTQDDAFFMKGGRYTTCDDPDCPHFYLALTKAKVHPKKNVVTGPAYLVIEGLPLPLGVPFGFFPFSDKYSSGVIMPTFGDEMERGFHLRDGGYYFAFSDHVDLALTGEIYTKGSWGLNARSTYRTRYKYSGNFDMGYLVTKYGDKGLPDYSVSKDMKINWTHSQDPKANMYRTFSAGVDFTTSSYNRNQLNSITNPRLQTQNTKGSSVSITQRFPNSPWSISGTMNVDQSSRDSIINMTLPNMSINMSRVNPFKRKDGVGSERWYEKIQLSYRGEFRNSIRTKEDQLLKSDFQKDWKKAMKHSIPISATFSVFDNFNITPSINYTERWYFEKSRQQWDNKLNRAVPSDTTYGFSRVYDFNFNVSLQTKVYGFYKPLFDKKTTIRHVFTPSVSFGYTPDFSDPRYGFYDSMYSYDQTTGEKKEERYSLFQNGIFDSPPKGERGTVNFQFDNNIEMKREMNDTIKKISLVDNFGLNFSYDMMREEFRWSDISTNIRLKLSKSLTVNLQGRFDPYTYDLKYDNNGRVIGLNRVNKTRIGRKGSFGRLMSTSYSISPSINQDTFKKWFGGNEAKKDAKTNEEESGEWDAQDTLLAEDQEAKGEKGSLHGRKKDYGDYDDDGYLRNEVKWSLSAQYSFSYAYDMSRWSETDKEYKYKLVHNLGFNGSIQPTKNWNFTFNTSYDFDYKKLVHVNCTISRDLHCWNLSATFVPVGYMKTYFVSLRANSSMLQDLKYDKRGRSSSYDPAWD